MAGQISAAEGAIRKGADTVNSTRNDLSCRIKTVESQMLAIGSNWVGPASIAFQRLMAQWNADASKVTRALIDFERTCAPRRPTTRPPTPSTQSTFNSLVSRMGAV